jgi:hypothetical protein
MVQFVGTWLVPCEDLNPHGRLLVCLFEIIHHIYSESRVEELDGRAVSAIAEAKHRSQWPVLGWVTKIYYLELLRASEGTLSRWSRLHLQSLAPTPVSRRVEIRHVAGRKNNCRIFITT